MTTTSYKVLSEHYNGPTSVSKSSEAPLISPKKIIVGRTHVAPNVTQFADRWVPYKVGADAVTVTSSGNKYSSVWENYERWGPKTQIDDNKITEWLDVGRKNPPANYSLIARAPNHMYIAGPPVGLHLHEEDTRVELKVSNEVANIGPMNGVGIRVSERAELGRIVREIMPSGKYYYETEAWNDIVGSYGYNSSPKIFGWGVLAKPEGAVANYIPLEGNAGYLNVGHKITEKVAAMIQHHRGNVTYDEVQAFKRLAILHELGHARGNIMEDEAKMEALQGKFEEEFGTRMAEEFKGTRMENVYRLIAKEGREYAKGWSRNNLSSLLDIEEKHSGIPKDVMVWLESEAYGEMEAGRLNPYNKTAYINIRIKELYGNIANFEDSVQGSDLERKVETEESDGKEGRSYSRESSENYGRVLQFSKYSKQNPKASKSKGKNKGKSKDKDEKSEDSSKKAA